MLAILDLDHFKSINDSEGHAVGDQVLQAFARTVQATVRNTDMLARWGGEEFVVLLPGMTLEVARNLCEQLRQRVEAIDCSSYAPGWQVTISGGVTERTGVTHHERLVGRADALLYEAKRAGRNRICG